MPQRRLLDFHLSMTLQLIIPFLKGLVHLITKSWRLKQSEGGGQKMMNKQWDAYMFQSLEEENLSVGKLALIREGCRCWCFPVSLSEIWQQRSPNIMLSVSSSTGFEPPLWEGSADLKQDLPIITGNEPNFLPPGLVKPTPKLLKRLQSDLEALTDIFDQAELPKMSVRISKLIAIYYGFLAAHLALGGFDDSFLKANGINYCLGVWGPDGEDDSLNFTDTRNCVQAIQRQAKLGTLMGSKVFFLTNNSMADAVERNLFVHQQLHG
jgi:hypothetical protein